MTAWTFKTARGSRWHTGALLYALTTYGAGWWLLFSGGLVGFLPGVLLLGHGMIIAAPAANRYWDKFSIDGLGLVLMLADLTGKCPSLLQVTGTCPT